MNPIAPKVAVISLLAYSFSVALSQQIYPFMIVPPLLLLVLNFGALREVFAKLLGLNIFVAIVVISLVFAGDFHAAALIFARSNLILLFALLAFCKRDEFDVALALNSLKLPKKLASVIFFSAKSIFLIRREFWLFRRALYIRGFTPKTDLLSYKTVANLVGVLVIRTIQRSEQLKKSLILRGFDGEIYTLKKSEILSRYDIMLLICVGLSIILRTGAII